MWIYMATVTFSLLALCLSGSSIDRRPVDSPWSRPPCVSPRRLFYCCSNIHYNPLPIGLDLFELSFLSQAFQSDTRNNLFCTFSRHRGAVSLSGDIQPLTTISFILSAADHVLWPVTKVQLRSPPGFRGPALKSFSSPRSTGHPTHQMLSFTLNHEHKAPR